jgi:hypothetical protein
MTARPSKIQVIVHSHVGMPKMESVGSVPEITNNGRYLGLKFHFVVRVYNAQKVFVLHCGMLCWPSQESVLESWTVATSERTTTLTQRLFCFCTHGLTRRFWLFLFFCQRLYLERSSQCNNDVLDVSFAG